MFGIERLDKSVDTVSFYISVVILYPKKDEMKILLKKIQKD